MINQKDSPHPRKEFGYELPSWREVVFPVFQPIAHQAWHPLRIQFVGVDGADLGFRVRVQHMVVGLLSAAGGDRHDACGSVGIRPKDLPVGRHCVCQGIHFTASHS